MRQVNADRLGGINAAWIQSEMEFRLRSQRIVPSPPRDQPLRGFNLADHPFFGRAGSRSIGAAAAHRLLQTDVLTLHPMKNCVGSAHVHHSPARGIIEKFGGQTQLAMLLGKRQSTIQYWWKVGLIPHRWHQPIFNLARDNGIPIAPWEFSAIQEEAIRHYEILNDDPDPVHLAGTKA